MVLGKPTVAKYPAGGPDPTIERDLRAMPADEPLRGREWTTGKRRIQTREGSGVLDGPTGPGDTPEETSRRLREWVERKDLDRALTLFAPDVMAYTPVTDRFRLDGKEELRYLLSTVFSTIDFMRYHTDVGQGDYRIVAFSSVVGGRDYEETKFLRFNERNEIREVVFYIRPLGGLLRMAACMGPRLLRRNGRPILAKVITPALRLLAAVWDIADRKIAPLCGPHRARN